MSVSCFNGDGRTGAKLLPLWIFQEPFARAGSAIVLSDYLREVSRHKIVLQLDTSFVPGQVAVMHCSAAAVRRWKWCH